MRLLSKKGRTRVGRELGRQRVTREGVAGGLLPEKLNWLFFRGSPSAATKRTRERSPRGLARAQPATGPLALGAANQFRRWHRGLTLLRLRIHQHPWIGHLLDLSLIVFSFLLPQPVITTAVVSFQLEVGAGNGCRTKCLLIYAVYALVPPDGKFGKDGNRLRR